MSVVAPHVESPPTLAVVGTCRCCSCAWCARSSPRWKTSRSGSQRTRPRRSARDSAPRRRTSPTSTRTTPRPRPRPLARTPTPPYSNACSSLAALFTLPFFPVRLFPFCCESSPRPVASRPFELLAVCARRVCALIVHV